MTRGTCREETCGREFTITAAGLVRRHKTLDARGRTTTADCPGGGEGPTALAAAGPSSGEEGASYRSDPTPSACPCGRPLGRHHPSGVSCPDGGRFQVNPHRSPLPSGRVPDRTNDTEEPWTTPSPPDQARFSSKDPGAGDPALPVSCPSVPGSGSDSSPSPRVSSTRSARVTDLFETAKAPDPAREIKRDRWGRYLLPHPATRKTQSWTRVTTFSSSVSDLYALHQWQLRTLAKGLSIRPDLVARVHTMDVKKDRVDLNKLVEDAKDAAGQQVAANLGTALHAFTEAVDGSDDPGEALQSVPPDQRLDVGAYVERMDEAGIRPVPGMIERVVCVPRFGSAGTFDRIQEVPGWGRVIGDVKSGKDLSFSWTEIAVQLAMYAHGVNENGVWDGSGWSPLDTPVREDWAMVMHVPQGEGRCDLYWVDLMAGWGTAQLCWDVREWRKRKDLHVPFGKADPPSGGFSSPLASLLRGEKGEEGPTPSPYPPPPSPRSFFDSASWEEKFAAVTERSQAADLYRQAASAGIPPARLARLADLGKRALAVLGNHVFPSGPDPRQPTGEDMVPPSA